MTPTENEGTQAAEQVALTIEDEDALFAYLDDALNQNGIIPQTTGYDFEGIPFFAWLDESGGDCVVMGLCRLIEDREGLTSKPAEPEYVGWEGRVSALVYPVQILCAGVKR